MSLAARIVELARAEVGVTESSGVPSRRYFYGMRDARRVPWCAALPLWVVEAAGYRGFPGHGAQQALHSVNAFERWCEESGLWHFGDPLPGDLVFYDDRGDSDPGPGRHMGIVVEVPSKRRLITVEGNVGNAVKLLTRSRAAGAALAPVGYARFTSA